MAMAHDTVAAIRQFQILPHGDKGIGFGDQHLSQHAAGAFTCKFAQRIVDGLTLTERKNSGISRHGVSLLSGGSGRLDTRLDTPPSINRRHLDSRIARCSFAGGFSVDDVEWDTDDGHYRVRLHGQWVNVPNSSVVTEPNRYGPAVVWPYMDSNGNIYIRCFLPGAGA